MSDKITVTLPKSEYDELVEFKRKVESGEMVLISSTLTHLGYDYNNYDNMICSHMYWSKFKMAIKVGNTESLNQEIISTNNELVERLEYADVLQQRKDKEYNEKLDLLNGQIRLLEIEIKMLKRNKGWLGRVLGL